ncbi:hypothetical protein [Herbidospora mongoliensis]|uniref:hypothetical protein n=1 Tax=Herbidospora mongoliensis TaxID=688067 RepID=UPI0008371C25|nr:hypothetical protein [Herbidospora mongoliensis]
MSRRFRFRSLKATMRMVIAPVSTSMPTANVHTATERLNPATKPVPSTAARHAVTRPASRDALAARPRASSGTKVPSKVFNATLLRLPDKPLMNRANHRVARLSNQAAKRTASDHIHSCISQLWRCGEIQVATIAPATPPIPLPARINPTIDPDRPAELTTMIMIIACTLRLTKAFETVMAE